VTWFFPLLLNLLVRVFPDFDVQPLVSFSSSHASIPILLRQENPRDQAVRFVFWSYCIPLNLFHFSYAVLTRDSLVSSRTIYVKRKHSLKLRWNTIQKVVILEWTLDIEAFFRPLILHRLAQASLKRILCRFLHGFWSFAFVSWRPVFTLLHVMTQRLLSELAGKWRHSINKHLTFVC
jgi:hypothetical protein